MSEIQQLYEAWSTKDPKSAGWSRTDELGKGQTINIGTYQFLVPLWALPESKDDPHAKYMHLACVRGLDGPIGSGVESMAWEGDALKVSFPSFTGLRPILLSDDDTDHAERRCSRQLTLMECGVME